MLGLLSLLILEKTASIKQGGESHPYLPRYAYGTPLDSEVRLFARRQSSLDEKGL